VLGRAFRQTKVVGKETSFELSCVPTGGYLLRYTGTEHTGVWRIQKQWLRHRVLTLSKKRAYLAALFDLLEMLRNAHS
jgi:hypothetical protein